MKLLTLLPASPLPTRHAAARYYGPILKAVDRLGIDITVFAVEGGDPAPTLEYFAETQISVKLFPPPIARNLLYRKLRSTWRTGWELSDSAFGQEARRALKGDDYEVILAEHPACQRIVEDDPRVLFSVHCFRHLDLLSGVENPSLAQRLRSFQLAREELSAINSSRYVRFLSARDQSIAPKPKKGQYYETIPLCLDIDDYDLLPGPSVPTVGVIGSMFWEPSRAAAVHFVQAIVPLLRVRRRDIKCVVAGWQAESALRPYIHGEDITILENFDDPRDVFARLSALVYAPPIATGMKVKIMEALAYGVPVITNAEGAHGFEVDPSVPLIRCKSDGEIVENVLRVLDDRMIRKSVAHIGRQCIERTFSPDAVATTMVRLLGEIQRGG